MTEYWIGRGNGYSYVVEKWTPWRKEHMEFVSQDEAYEYFHPDDEQE